MIQFRPNPSPILAGETGEFSLHDLYVDRAGEIVDRAGEIAAIDEETANSLTHGLGLVLSIVGMFWLVLSAFVRGTSWHMIACTTYGASLVLLYGASTLYHSCTRRRMKAMLRVADHACIYLLIAGTYTPFLLISLRSPLGWTLLASVWTMALAGIAMKVVWADRLDRMSSLPYIAMGWLAVLAIKPLLSSVPAGGMLWLVAGGIFYTAGMYFFRRDELPFNHAIWHLFVLAGSGCHYYAVMLYLLP